MTKISTSTVPYMHVASGTRKVEPVSEIAPVPMDPQDTDLSRLLGQDAEKNYRETVTVYDVRGQLKPL